jgi:uncharacterized protein (DUF1684 family)
VRALKAEDGWLNLEGLLWLNEGVNKFGAGINNQIVFPAGTIASNGGELIKIGDSVWLKPALGTSYEVNGKMTKNKIQIFSDAQQFLQLSITETYALPSSKEAKK